MRDFIYPMHDLTRLREEYVAKRNEALRSAPGYAKLKLKPIGYWEGKAKDLDRAISAVDLAISYYQRP